MTGRVASAPPQSKRGALSGQKLNQVGPFIYERSHSDSALYIIDTQPGRNHNAQPDSDLRSSSSAEEKPPENYIGPAIAACLCCFFPTGLCALIIACRAQCLVEAGELEKARKVAAQALNLLIATVAIGVIIDVLAAIGGIAFRIYLLANS